MIPQDNTHSKTVGDGSHASGEEKNEPLSKSHETENGSSSKTSPRSFGGGGTAFPLDALPHPLGVFSAACAASLPAPAELVAIPALVMAAAAIGNSRVIRLKPGWTEPASLFAAVVSSSGTMKTPALKMAAKPFQDLDSPTVRTWTSDVTVERLGGLLAENPRGLLLLRDELSAWVKSMNQYKAGGNGSDRQFYLSVWAGVPSRVDRKGGSEGQPSTITIKRPCLSIVGGIPPDVVPDLDENTGQQDGFLPRLLFAYPDATPVRWVNQSVPDALRQAYDTRIKELFQIPFKDEPGVLSLHPVALKAFIQWHDLHCGQMEEPGLSPFLKAAYAKLRGYCARLALIHAVTQDPSTKEVGLESVLSAIRLIGYFKIQASKVMPSLPYSQHREVDRCRKEIINKLSVCRSLQRSIKKRDLQRNSAFNADIFNEAFDSLSIPTIETEIGTGLVSLYDPTNRHAEIVEPRLVKEKPATRADRLRGKGKRAGVIAEGERNTVERAEALFTPEGGLQSVTNQ